jgi:hypothetical protein
MRVGRNVRVMEQSGLPKNIANSLYLVSKSGTMISVPFCRNIFPRSSGLVLI